MPPKVAFSGYIKPGPKPIYGKTMTRICVSLPANVARQITALGDGNTSQGLRIMAMNYFSEDNQGK